MSIPGCLTDAQVECVRDRHPNLPADEVRFLSLAEAEDMGLDPDACADEELDIGPLPYADVDSAYRAKGWRSVLPLRSGQKYPPPTGFTGAARRAPNDANRHEWADRVGNYALALPDTIIGIDVDAYDGKRGADTLAELEAELGPLPDTWRSSARPDDDVSGIRFFAVPPGLHFKDPGGDIELVQYAHRYAVVAPSIHPKTGLPYHWYQPGEIEPEPFGADGIPDATDIAQVPMRWIERFTDDERGTLIGGESPATDAEVADWLDDTDNRLTGAGDYWRKYCADQFAKGSRHDTMVSALAHLKQTGDERPGYRRREAFGIIADHFRTAIDGERNADIEITKAMAWTVANVKGDPEPPSGVDASTGEILQADDGPSTDLVTTLSDPVSGETLPPDARVMTHPDSGERFTEADWIDLAFWQRRGYLRDIWNSALLRRISPDALLGVVMARTAATIANDWQLPPIVGGAVPVNHYSLLRSCPGDGKSGSVAVGREVLPFDAPANGGLGYDVKSLTKFTGAGLAEAYMVEQTKPDPNNNDTKITEKVFSGQSVFCVIDEGRALAQNTSNAKTDMVTPLLTARMGGDIGSTGATDQTTRSLPDGLYRFTTVILGQPEVMEDLTAYDGQGLSQRFTAFNASPLRFSGMTGEGDRDNLPICRGGDSPPPVNPHGNNFIKVAESVENEVVRLRDLRSTPLEQWTPEELELLENGDIDAAAHVNLNRLTCAAVLAFMDGRSDVNAEDWELAGHTTTVSERLWLRARNGASRGGRSKSTAEQNAEDREQRTEEFLRYQEQLFRSITGHLLKDNEANRPVQITAAALGKRPSSKVRKQLGELEDRKRITPTEATQMALDEGVIESVEKDGEFVGFVVSSEYLGRA